MIDGDGVSGENCEEELLISIAWLLPVSKGGLSLRCARSSPSHFIVRSRGLMIESAGRW